MNDIEKLYVHDTYRKIADVFSNSRTYIWKSVKLFLDSIKSNSIILEVGSGNGKNLTYRKDCYPIAVDLCFAFSKMTNSKGLESAVVNNIALPFRTNSIDYILSIAVLHHLSTYERRLLALKELVRVLKLEGELLVQVWAYRQPKNSKRKFITQENLVSFMSPDKKLIEYRYYHVFMKNELDNMICKLNNVVILNSYWDVGNWVVRLKKIN